MTEDNRPANLSRRLSSLRLFVIGLVVTIIALGLALIMQAIAQPATSTPAEPVDALANSKDDCVTCHRRTSPGIVQQFGHSTMAAAEVTCRDCHEVKSDYPGAVLHEGTYVLQQPTTAMCQECHATEVAQYYRSRHALPAYVAYAGSKDLSPQLLAQYEAIPEGSYAPDKSRNALYALEGPDITRFACETCHGIGEPSADGCGYDWHWEAEPGTLKVTDFPAATCAICHMSGFGASTTTHDVGDRLAWYLFPPISERRPDWQENRTQMQNVCLECHNVNFIETFYADADKATEAVNAWVVESNEIVAPLKEQGLLTDAPFDEPIDFIYFNLWHHWGRTAKFGAWMQGPDYVQWHGAYEILNDLAELREIAHEKLEAEEAGD
jgi:hypothetical protein